jgi:DNA repair photolyase
MGKFRVSETSEINQSLAELEDIFAKGDKWRIGERLHRGSDCHMTFFDLKFDGSIEPIHGRCPFQCEYCYSHLPYKDECEVDKKKYNLHSADYRGPLRLNENVFHTDLGEGKFIIVGMGNDFWTAPTKWIDRTLDFLKDFPNRYNFITKNPARIGKFLDKIPEGSMLSCTIETDAYQMPGISKAPPPAARAESFANLDWPLKQLVLMPVFPFNSQRFFDMICEINPQYLFFNTLDVRPWTPHPSPYHILKCFEFLKVIVRYTNIKFIGDSRDSF